MSPNVRRTSVRGFYASPVAKILDEPSHQSDRAADDRLFANRDTTTSLNKIVGPGFRAVVVDDSYFGLLGLPILRGRGFSETDQAHSGMVALVSNTFAHSVWRGTDPIGKVVQLAADGLPITVVGVVGDVRGLQHGARGYNSSWLPLIYLSDRQSLTANPEIIARKGDGARALDGDAIAATHFVDSALPVRRVLSLAEQNDGSLRATRLISMLLAGFSICGILLCVVGIYGIVGYSISIRRREIGIRMALGAVESGVIRLFVDQTIRTVGIGLAIGLLISSVLSPLLAAFVFADQKNSFGVVLALIALFLVTTAVATFVSARAATDTNLVNALRTE